MLTMCEQLCIIPGVLVGKIWWTIDVHFSLSSSQFPWHVDTLHLKWLERTVSKEASLDLSSWPSVSVSSRSTLPDATHHTGT